MYLHPETFGTKNFVNKRTTYMTLSVFSQNWSKNKNVDMGFVKMTWLQKAISSEGGQI